LLQICWESLAVLSTSQRIFTSTPFVFKTNPSKADPASLDKLCL